MVKASALYNEEDVICFESAMVENELLNKGFKVKIKNYEMIFCYATVL